MSERMLKPIKLNIFFKLTITAFIPTSGIKVRSANKKRGL
ncbi:hypothetical protein D035_2589 [Vibrio parahaemolyticus VP250]|nr:hypothetical protein D035_2589 [Vibrio parahaemolyticus VP250]ETJ92253.1 hypothetical protein D029_0513 [Vibrio parahaemolyticus 970107]